MVVCLKIPFHPNQSTFGRDEFFSFFFFLIFVRSSSPKPQPKVGIGTLKVSRYRYSVLAPKSNSVPVLGTPFKMYRLTFAVPVLFEKNMQYQSSTIGGKKK